MDWYYAANGEQLGPVSNEQFEALVASRSIDGGTLVWREGFEKWVPYITINKTVMPPLPVLGSSAIAEQGTLLWRSGKDLVTTLDFTLPERCIKCNKPATKPIQRKLYWHHPAVYLVAIFNLLIYAIVAICVRKKATSLFYVCDRHRAVRRNAILTGWGLTIAGFGLLFFALTKNTAGYVLAGAALVLIGIIYGIIRCRLLIPKKIDGQHAWVGGCHPDFVATFPEWPK